METTESINRSHKDRVFRLLFNDKKNLIELYNCLNGTNYTDIHFLCLEYDIIRKQCRWRRL